MTAPQALYAVIPFRFGPDARQLYGVFHSAVTSRVPSTAVLLCNPFGQEAVRTHRLYRILAERLARNGIAVLRFDYFGTGDSAGDDEGGDMPGWIGDTAAAHAELVRRSRSTRVIWVGARLGGTIALLSSATLERPLGGLVLWDPVVNGAAYVRELTGRHADFVRSMQRYASVPTTPTELLGFALGAGVARQLRALAVDSFTEPRVDRAVLIAREADTDATAFATWLRETGLEVTSRAYEHNFDFASDEAMNTSLVPAETLQILISQVQALAT